MDTRCVSCVCKVNLALTIKIDILRYKYTSEFIVNFLTGKALVESTTWLKKESEEAARNRGSVDDKADPLKKWFINGGATFKKWNAETKHKADNEINRYKAIVSNISPRVRWFKTLT